MKRSAKDKRLDYFPVISFFLFWLLSAAAGAGAIDDPDLTRLGIITLPAVAAMAITALKIRKNNRQDD